MPRPPKCRRVAFMPDVTYFKPAGIPLRVLEEVQLSVEEAEAIRLKDLEGLEQEEGAEKMNISRPTFQRVLAAARQKMADALLNGKAIRIEGGVFELNAVGEEAGSAASIPAGYGRRRRGRHGKTRDSDGGNGNEPQNTGPARRLGTG